MLCSMISADHAIGEEKTRMELSRRERVHRAMHYMPVDKVPVRYYYAPVGYYEHGEKLNDLFASLPGDFEPFRRVPIPQPAKSDFDEQGRYYVEQTDEWGVTREFRIFGIQGIPSKYRLNTPEDLLQYQTPAPPSCEGEDYEAYAHSIRERIANDYYVTEGCGNFYERMIALYGDENVLCDMLTDEPELHVLADKIMAYNEQFVKRAIKAGADGISFGDDYGTERNLLMSPQCWRRFIKPRLQKLFQPAVAAGKDIHFHSCGQIMPILEDLREIGVTSIWPQLPAYNMKELAQHCRNLGLAVEIHTDRAKTMTYGTPEDVRELVKREYDTFQMSEGGAWFYVEADNGFPFENIEALVETIKYLRNE